MLNILKSTLEWLDAKWRLVIMVVSGLLGLVFWSKRSAVKSFKDNHDEEANRRASAAIDAATAASTDSPDVRDERMQREGWYRD